MAKATYQCTALAGTSKVGKLTCDAAGYYNPILGALNFFNSAGAFYAFEPAKKLFEESSSLMRRVSSGSLRGEYGHPRLMPGQSKRDFLLRVMDINEQCVSHHIKEVYIDDKNVRDKNGNPIVAIMGLVKPTGPFGDKLAASFENENENVCFSIRSLTDDFISPAGQHIKHLQQIITWDYVNEPGISVANKWTIPTLEQMKEMETIGFSREQIVLAKNMATVGLGMESDRSRMLEETMKRFGWSEDHTKAANKILLPISARW